MDSFRSHRTEAVKKLIYENGHRTLFFPGRTTSYLQPLDVSINGPFKAFLRKEYEDWMANSEPIYLKSGKRQRASYDTVLEWVSKALKCITPQVIQQSFISCGLSHSINLYDLNSRLRDRLGDAQVQFERVDEEVHWDQDLMEAHLIEAVEHLEIVDHRQDEPDYLEIQL